MTGAPTSLPSIHDLGRRIAALYVAYDRCDAEDVHDEGHAVRQRAEAGMDISYAQITAAKEMVCTMPAVTLADAAVQVAPLLTIRYQIDGAAGYEAILRRLEKKLDYLLFSALPLIAEAAGLDMVEMGWADFARLRVSHFAALEDVR